jgi:hypothetical protein
MAFDRELFWEKRNEHNRQMRNAARRGARALRNSLAAQDAIDTRQLRNTMGYKLRKVGGEVRAIKFKTLRYGLILEKGAGRGWKGGVKRHSNESTRPRQAKPWISDAMDGFLPDLADTVASLKGDNDVAEIDKQYRSFYGQTNFKVGS